MPRLRKVSIKDPPEVKSQKKPKGKEKPAKKLKQEPHWMQGDGLSVAQLILSIQKTDCNNAKVIKELKKLYKKMKHDAFVSAFIKMIMLFLMRDEQNEFAPRVLKFIGLFVASYGEETDEDGSSHPLIKAVFAEILSVTSKSYYIRARICSLVTQIMSSFSARAELDEELMDTVIARMIGVFIKDISPVVRQNAIMALQRLQDPDNTEDQVTKAYVYHMETDSVAKVRQSVITAIAKKITTIPFVIERLRDNDEKVRRHTYLQMSSYAVKSYKIIDRINIMTAGLYDRSEIVKKVVHNVLLPNWLASYENDFVEYIKAIKLDASDTELSKFRTLAQDALNAVFNKFKVSHILNYLNISTENEFRNCLPVERASNLEWLVVWKVAIKRHQDFVDSKHTEPDGDENEISFGEEANESITNIEILPELSIFCDFIEKFLTNFKVDSSDGDMKLRIMTLNHCLIVLLEIAQMNDLSEEVGRKRLQLLLKKILMEIDVSDHSIKEISHLIEQIIPKVELRLHFFNDIVTDLLSLSSPTEYSRQETIDKLIGKADSTTELLASKLKMSMMELKEKEMMYVEAKRYAEAHKVSEEFAKKNSELIELLRPFDEVSSSSSQTIVESLSSIVVAKKATPSEILKCLRVSYFAIVSKGVKSITPEIHKTYNSFVRFHLESSDVAVRVWALKTATAYSLLYESLAKEVYDILKSQLFKSTNYHIWEVTIGCIVDLLLRYTIDKMDFYETDADPNNSTQNRSKRGGRTLYTDEDEEEPAEMNFLANVPIMRLMEHLHKNTLDSKIQKAITIAFCKLILHGQFVTRSIISDYLVAYFNPATDSEINQILGNFFESIIRKKKQEYLEEALVSTLVTILVAPAESPLREVKQETVIRYVIEATRPIFCSNGLNLHNTLCLKLIDVMKTNPGNKDVTRVFSREVMTLEIGDDPLLKNDIIAQIDALLDLIAADVKTKKNLLDFRAILKGTYKTPLEFSSTAMSANVEENEDAGIAEEAEAEDSEMLGETEDDSPESLSERVAFDEIMDISISKANVRDVVINVTKLEEPNEEGNNSTIDSNDVTMVEDKTLDIPATPSNLEELEVTQKSIEEKTIPDTETQEFPETLPEEYENDSSDDEFNETVLQATKIESSDDEVIEASPDVPRTSARKKSVLSNKRQLEFSATKMSPMQKNPRNTATPKTMSTRQLASSARRASSDSGSAATTPKTPKSSKVLTAGFLTPKSIERTTRRQAKEELVQSITLTRSASKKMNIEIPEVQKPNPGVSKPTKIVKKTALPVPTKASILRAAKVESEALKKQTAPGKKSADGEASKTSRASTRQKIQDAKQRPRWN